MEMKKAMGYGQRATQLYKMKLGKRWYFISRRNIDFKGPLKRQADLINALLKGMVAHVEGTYSKKNHLLTVIL